VLTGSWRTRLKSRQKAGWHVLAKRLCRTTQTRIQKQSAHFLSKACGFDLDDCGTGIGTARCHARKRSEDSCAIELPGFWRSNARPMIITAPIQSWSAVSGRRFVGIASWLTRFRETSWCLWSVLWLRAGSVPANGVPR